MQIISIGIDLDNCRGQTCANGFGCVFRTAVVGIGGRSKPVNAVDVARGAVEKENEDVLSVDSLESAAKRGGEISAEATFVFLVAVGMIGIVDDEAAYLALCGVDTHHVDRVVRCDDGGDHKLAVCAIRIHRDRAVRHTNVAAEAVAGFLAFSRADCGA